MFNVVVDCLLQAVAQAHKLPWQMLLSYKQKWATADEVRDPISLHCDVMQLAVNK